MAAYFLRKEKYENNQKLYGMEIFKYKKSIIIINVSINKKPNICMCIQIAVAYYIRYNYLS